MILATASPLDNITYDDLYARWERGNWRATEIDFTRGQAPVGQRVLRVRAHGRALELLALLLGRGRGGRRALAVHRRRAARGAEVLPRHPAGGRGPPRRLLQALHVRGRGHRRHHRRGAGGDPARSSPGASSRSSTASSGCPTSCGATARSQARPGDHALPRVIEATLAQPGQHFITSYLEDSERLPGFREGMENVAQDEQRHIGFGVKMLSDLARDGPGRARRRGRPAARGDPLDGLRAGAAELGRALHGVLRLHARGHRRGGRHLARDQDAHAPACPSTSCRARRSSRSPGTPRERASTGKRMVKAGYLGEKTGPPSTDPRDVRLLLRRGGRRARRRRRRQRPGTIQWDFTDAEPWHVVVANGDTRAERGPRRTRRSASARASRTSWTSPRGREDPLRWSRAGACARAATCAGSSARARCSRRSPSGGLASPGMRIAPLPLGRVGGPRARRCAERVLRLHARQGRRGGGGLPRREPAQVAVRLRARPPEPVRGQRARRRGLRGRDLPLPSAEPGRAVADRHQPGPLPATGPT